MNKEKENKNKEKETFHVEGNIEIKELNVRGHYDAVYEGDNVYLFDFKTIANWSYSKKFGKSKDFDPSIHQELQLGTYGYAIQEEFGRLDGMYLVYYNKDNSSMNSKEIPKTFVNRAYNFWYAGSTIGSWMLACTSLTKRLACIHYPLDCRGNRGVCCCRNWY